MLAGRSGKGYELQQWIGKQVTLKEFVRRPSVAYQVDVQTLQAEVLECNQFYLTVFLNNRKCSYPLTSLEISYDHVQNRLQIEREPPVQT